MKKSILSTLILLLTGLFTLSSAQTVDEILEKHFKAIGQEKISAVKTYLIKAKVNQMGMELPMEMKMKRPNKFRLEVDIQGQKMIQAFDGEKGWMIMPMMGPDVQDLSGEQLKQAMEQTNLDGELYNYKDKGLTIEMAGKVNMDDKETYRLKVTGKDNTVKNYFIDANTYLINKVKAKVEAMGQSIEVEQNFKEYKTIEGTKIASKIVSNSPMGTAEVTMQDIQLNIPVDDAIFARPAK